MYLFIWHGILMRANPFRGPLERVRPDDRETIARNNGNPTHACSLLTSLLQLMLTDDNIINSFTESGQESRAERGEGLAAEHQGDPHGGQVTVQYLKSIMLKKRMYEKENKIFLIYKEIQNGAVS
jgi:hypothetical protein